MRGAPPAVVALEAGDSCLRAGAPPDQLGEPRGPLQRWRAAPACPAGGWPRLQPEDMRAVDARLAVASTGRHAGGLWRSGRRCGRSPAPAWRVGRVADHDACGPARCHRRSPCRPGYRPGGGDLIFNAWSLNRSARFDVNNLGDRRCNRLPTGGGNSFVSLDGISFSTLA